jgi:hypothetical protein
MAKMWGMGANHFSYTQLWTSAYSMLFNQLFDNVCVSRKVKSKIN